MRICLLRFKTLEKPKVRVKFEPSTHSSMCSEWNALLMLIWIERHQSMWNQMWTCSSKMNDNRVVYQAMAGARTKTFNCWYRYYFSALIKFEIRPIGWEAGCATTLRQTCSMSSTINLENATAPDTYRMLSGIRCRSCIFVQNASSWTFFETHS